VRDLVIRLLKQGLRPYEIAQKLSVSYDVVHEIAFASGISYPGKHLTTEQKREIQRLRELHGLPIRAVAARLGISKTTAGRWSRARFLAVQDSGGQTVRPQQLKTPKRCPRHGLVLLWPCVACAADPI
jgi:transposase